MLLKKLYIFLIFALNLYVTTSLRFFQSRKRKKKCMVRDQWTFHYVNCTSKYQKCCSTGCCDNVYNNATTTYVKVFIVCALIVGIVTFVYIEMWCKKKCEGLKKSWKLKKEERRREGDENSSGQEMEIFPSDGKKRRQLEKIGWKLPLPPTSQKSENTPLPNAPSTT